MKKMNFTTLLVLVLKTSGAAAMGLVLLTLLASIAQNVMIVVFAAFLDGVLDFFNGIGNVTIQHILILICSYIALQLFIWMEPNLFEWLSAKCQIRIRKHCNDVLLNKYAKIQYRYTEDEETLNLAERVMPQAEEKIIECFRCYLDIAGFIVKVVGILIILAGAAIWTSVFIMVCSVPLFILAIKSGRATYETAKEVTQVQRQAEYFSDIALGKDFVYERKLFQYGNHINSQWREKFEFARKTKLKTSLRWYVKSKMASVFTALIGILTTIALINPTLNGEMTVGLYISLVGAVYEFVKVMAWDFMENVDWLTNTKEYMKDYNVFMNLEEVKETENPEESYAEFENLEFWNVSFRYPNSETYALKNLSFTIEANKKYCIVGVNGSGKTTMVKLVLGLYEDYEGKILLNGKDIKSYDKKEIGKICSAVFQDFSKYAISVRDNILLGNLKYGNAADDKALSNIISEVGLEDEIEKLEQGVDTILGSHFKEGQNFSGGQWQRLAIARNLIGGSDVVFFDEPTAALDPIAERNFYQSLNHMTNKKTIIVISHRLAVARYSDMIYVVDDGAVSEAGSFEQLMEQQGAFSKMYESQRAWYDEETK